MLSTFIGRDKFINGLKKYLEMYQLSNAKTDQLWEQLKSASGVDVKKVMDTWTLQMGFPLVTIKRDTAKRGKAKVTQKRFLEDESATVDTPSPFNYKWEIPLTYTTKSGTPRTVNDITWMHKNGDPLEISWQKSDGWIKCNLGGIGFYRCNYDKANWKALKKQLEEDHTVLSAIDRATIIDDAFALAKAKQLSQTMALDMTPYVQKDTDYAPVMTVFDNLNKLKLMLEYTPAVGHFEAYIRKISKPILAKIGLENDGDHLRKKLRTNLIAIAIVNGEETAVAKCKEIFKNWMDNGAEIPTAIISAVLGAGIKFGTEREWNFVWEKQKTTQVHGLKMKLLQALAATNDQELLKKYLRWALDKTKLTEQLGRRAIVDTAINKVGRPLVWDLIKSKWAILFERYGASTNFGPLLYTAVRGFSTQEKYDEVKEFFNSKDLGTGSGKATEGLQSIKSNIDWLRLHKTEAIKWFRDATSNSS